MQSNPRIPFRLSSERPALPPLDGRRLLVHVGVNVEHWPFDRPMPRTVLPGPHGRAAVPDIPNFSWAEYGLRCGMPRIIEILSARGIRASAFVNATICDVYPRVAEAMLEAGWEFQGHGWIQEPLDRAEDERAVIDRSLETLRDFSGQRVRGWLGPGLVETNSTPDHLKAAGIDYVHDWVLDDLPVWMQTAAGPLLSLPYSVELNDVPIYAVEKLGSEEMLRRVELTLDQFAGELDRGPQILTLPLHPHIMGVPHRAIVLARIIDLLAARDDTIFVTGAEIADWFSAACPADI